MNRRTFLTNGIVAGAGVAAIGAGLSRLDAHGLVDDLTEDSRQIPHLPRVPLASSESSYPRVIDVAVSGGQYPNITAAMAAITDASPTNRYLLRVWGWVTEPGVVSWKSHVHAIGYTGSVYGTWTPTSRRVLDFFNNTDVYVKDLDVVIQGEPNTGSSRAVVIDANDHPGGLDGASDETLVLENVRCINECGGSANYAIGMGVAGIGNCTLRHIYARGGPGGNNCHGFAFSVGWNGLAEDIHGQGWGVAPPDNSGISIMDYVRGVFIRPRGWGSNQRNDGGYLPNSNGFTIWDSAAPLMIDALARGGRFLSPDFNLSFNTGVRLVNPMSDLPQTAHHWMYDAANGGRFRPYADMPYYLMSLMVWPIIAQAPGVTLDIGTAPGAHDVAQGIPLHQAIERWWLHERVAVPANGYLYATPSSPISGYVQLLYTVIENFDRNHIVLFDGPGHWQIEGGHFIANPATQFVLLMSDKLATTTAGGGARFQVRGIHFQHLNRARPAIKTYQTLDAPPIYQCLVEGSVSGVTNLHPSNVLV